MSTMMISNDSIVAAFNSLIDEMVRDSSKQLQSGVMYALCAGEQCPSWRNFDHMLSMLRIFAEQCQAANQMAYSMQYFGSHNTDEFSKINTAKIGLMMGQKSIGLHGIVKFFDCIKYNSYDDYATDNQQAWIATIERVRVAIMDRIMEQLPEYKSASWG